MCEMGKQVLIDAPVEIDKCLVPLIKTLNNYGIQTTHCCCGHGKNTSYVIIRGENSKMRMRDVDGNPWIEGPYALRLKLKLPKTATNADI